MEEAPRPSSPRVLGILSIVFGSIVTAFSLFGLVTARMNTDRLIAPSMREASAIYLAKLQPWATIVALVMVAMSVALIVIGIGQRRYRRWAQQGAVLWSCAALVVLMGLFAHQFLVTAPALDEFLRSLATFSDASLFSGMGVGLGFASLLLYAPYPIILLVMMRRPVVVAAMTE